MGWLPGARVRRRAKLGACIGVPLLVVVWIAWFATGLHLDTPVNLPEAWHGTVSGVEGAEVVSLTAEGSVLHRGARVTLNELAESLTGAVGRPLVICADEDAHALGVSHLMEVGLRTDPHRSLFLAVRCLGRIGVLPIRTSRGITDTFVTVMGEETASGRYLCLGEWVEDRAALRAHLIHRYERWLDDGQEEPRADLEEFAEAWAYVGLGPNARCDHLAQATDVFVGLGAPAVVVVVRRAHPFVLERERLDPAGGPLRAIQDGAHYMAPMELPLVRYAEARYAPWWALIDVEPGPYAFRQDWQWRLPSDVPPMEKQLEDLETRGRLYSGGPNDPGLSSVAMLYSRHLPWRRYVETVSLVLERGWSGALIGVRVLTEDPDGGVDPDRALPGTDHRFHGLPVGATGAAAPALRVEVREGPRYIVGQRTARDLAALRDLLGSLQDPGPAALHAPAGMNAGPVVEVLAEMIAAGLVVVDLGVLEGAR